MRLPMYFYTTRNLVGSTLASIAGVLYLSGVIGEYWWLIVAGSYGIGALAAPGARSLDVSMRSQMNDEQLIAGLRTIARRAPKLLPAAVVPDVLAICTLMETLLPSVSSGTAGAQVAYDVRAVASEYLPQTLAAYVKLPPAYRSLARSADGKDPNTMLAEQITTMRTKLESLVANIASADAVALAENGRFLRERFAKPVTL